MSEGLMSKTIAWLTVLVVLAGLMVLANGFTEGETFHGVAPAVTFALALGGLFALQQVTRENAAWEIDTQKVGTMGLGAGLYAVLSYLFNTHFEYALGPVMLSPQICLPILFGYAFGPIVGFFTGAVGVLLGDFFTGWGVFPPWIIAGGLTGLVPGLVSLLADRDLDLDLLSRLVIVITALTAGLILIHPRVPKPWTGEIQDFSLWAWALVLSGVVMTANSHLLERVSVTLAAVNLWGALGILVGAGFAALTHLWIYEYTLGTALVGEFAPAAGNDILNLVIFTPLLRIVYITLRRWTDRRRQRRPRTDLE